MTVSNGQIANQTTFNNAYVSKTATTGNDVTGKINLINGEIISDHVIDLQKKVADAFRHTLNSNDEALQALGEKTFFPHGWQAGATLDFSVTGREVSFSSVDVLEYYIQGRRYQFQGSSETVVIPDVTGAYLITLGSEQDLNAVPAGTFGFADNAVFVAACYWNQVQQKMIYFASELHTILWPKDVWQYTHRFEGTRYAGGLALSDFTMGGSGNLDVHAQFSVMNGAIRDEDLAITIANNTPQALSPILAAPVWYYEDSSWKSDVATNFPFKGTLGGRLNYNNVTGTGTQVQADNTRFVLSHIVATNDIYNPIIVIQGQNQYTSQNLAREGANNEINNIVTVGLPIQEFVFIGTVIAQTANAYTNTVKARIISTDTGENYVDFRTSGVSPSGAASSHGNLAGLGNDDHLQYALLGGRVGDTLSIDTIAEKTAANGVKIEDIKIIDNNARATTSAGLHIQNQSGGDVGIFGAGGGTGTTLKGGTNIEGSLVVNNIGGANNFLVKKSGGSNGIAYDATVDVLQISSLTDFNTTNAIKLPSGDTSQRPTGLAGMLRFNNETGTVEGFNGSEWGAIAGGGGGGLSAWETANAYKIGQVVHINELIYLCTADHTSTTFNADIANWSELSSSAIGSGIENNLVTIGDDEKPKDSGIAIENVAIKNESNVFSNRNLGAEFNYIKDGYFSGFSIDFWESSDPDKLIFDLAGSILRSTGSTAVIVKEAGSALGETIRNNGVGEFLIDTIDLSQILTLEFDGDFSDANYSDGDLAITLEHFDGSDWSSFLGQTYDIAGGKGQYKFTFQTNPTHIRHRVALVVKTAKTEVYEGLITGFRLYPQAIGSRGCAGWPQYDITTLYTASGAGFVNRRATAIPYKTLDGTWRLKGEIQYSLSSTSRTGSTITLTGVSMIQPLAGNSLLVPARATGSNVFVEGWVSSSTQIQGTHSSATTTGYAFQFDVELDSKPTWAVDYSNVELSDSFTGVDITVIAQRIVAQSVTAGVTDLQFTTINQNFNNAWDGSGFIAPTTDWYLVIMNMIYPNSNSCYITPYINNVHAINTYGAIVHGWNLNAVASGSQFIFLKAGERLSYRSGTSITLGAETNGIPTIQIKRLQTGTPIFAKQPSIGELVAWVNFDGTTTPPTIRASGNVSSVARSATGHFTVSFTKELPDANYTMAGTVGLNTSSEFGRIIAFRNHTTPIRTASQVTIITSTSGSSSTTNMTYNEIQFYR